MLTCRPLAQRYAQESQNPIPAASASGATKKAWLLTERWGCIVPGSTDPTFDTDACRAALDAVTTNQQHKPYLNYLEEKGFLAWVNERGLKCVNKVTGLVFGLDTATGVVKIPDANTPQPDAACWDSCLSVTEDSDACFRCVNTYLKDHPDVCPDVDLTQDENETLLQDAARCHACIGTRSPDPAYADYFRCITSEVHPPLSILDVVGFVLVGVFVLSVAVVWSVWHWYLRPRHRRRLELERARENLPRVVPGIG